MSIYPPAARTQVGRVPRKKVALSSICRFRTGGGGPEKIWRDTHTHIEKRGTHERCQKWMGLFHPLIFLNVTYMLRKIKKLYRRRKKWMREFDRWDISNALPVVHHRMTCLTWLTCQTMLLMINNWPDSEFVFCFSAYLQNFAAVEQPWMTTCTFATCRFDAIRPAVSHVHHFRLWSTAASWLWRRPASVHRQPSGIAGAERKKK